MYCSETTLTGESRFHISTPLGILTWVPCDRKQTGSPLDQRDMVRMKWDCRLSTVHNFFLQIYSIAYFLFFGNTLWPLFWEDTHWMLSILCALACWSCFRYQIHSRSVAESLISNWSDVKSRAFRSDSQQGPRCFITWLLLNDSHISLHHLFELFLLHEHSAITSLSIEMSGRGELDILIVSSRL